MISYEEAVSIAAEFAEEVSDTFSKKIEAIFAIGSLGSDYYRPGQSDIDTAIITRFDRADIVFVSDKIEEIATRYQNKYKIPKGFRAIVFAKEQLYPPYVKSEELIQEILRLKTQSKLIYGNFDTQDIPMPDPQAIKEDILNFQEWSDSQPPFIHTPVTMVNSTLLALKCYLLLKYNIIEFNKFKVIGLYMQNNPPMVNHEIFEFINNFLHQHSYEWNDEICKKYTEWHDELYRVINALVLFQS